MMGKLSIVIPVYNVEKYLSKCLDSILVDNAFTGQVICVNDGSTDGSAAILEEYAKKYSNIEIITQPNAGLSAARNAGLKVAKGEYVCFLDSDDYWEPYVLKGLMEQVELDDLDVLRFDYQNVNENYEVFNPNKSPRYVDSKTEVVDGKIYLNTRMGYACYAVMYIMRKSIVPSFTEGIHFEDVDWLPRMMLRANRVNSSTKVVYNYLVRQGSITQTEGKKEKLRKNLEDRMTVLANLTHLYKNHPDCDWLLRMRSSMTAGTLMTVAREFYSEQKSYIERLQEIEAFPLVIANQGKTYARRAQVINLLGPRIYCTLMYLRKVLKN